MKLLLWRCHWQDIWKTGTIIDCAMCHSKESVPVVLPVVVEMLNPSDEFGGVVLWREQQPLAKVFFVSDQVQKLLDMPSYMVVLIHLSAERVKCRLHHNIIQWKMDNSYHECSWVSKSSAARDRIQQLCSSTEFWHIWFFNGSGKYPTASPLPLLTNVLNAI